MIRQSVRLATIRGVAVGVNWSVIVILALLAWELAEFQFPARAGHPGVGDWVAGVVGAVIFLLSLFAHEVSHALVARHYGVVVRSITLFAFGGVTLFEGEAHTPKADFRIAAVGPATSAVLAGVFGGAEAVAHSASMHGLPLGTLSWLWEINLLLAVFNLVPAAPLDGGRILRAALWRRWRDHWRASVAAARFGRGFGFTLVVLGVLGLLYVSVVALWAALIGFFLYSAAGAEEQYALLQSALAGLTVDRVMTAHPPSVPGPMTVTDLLALFQWQYRGDVVVVTDEHGFPMGVVTAQVVRKVPAERLQTTSAADIAIPRALLPVGRPDEPAEALVERMMSHEGRPALVFDGTGHLAGVVSLADVERAASWVDRGRAARRR